MQTLMNASMIMVDVISFVTIQMMAVTFVLAIMDTYWILMTKDVCVSFLCLFVYKGTQATSQ